MLIGILVRKRFDKGDIIRITPKEIQKPTVRGIEQIGIKDSSTQLLEYKSDNLRVSIR